MFVFFVYICMYYFRAYMYEFLVYIFISSVVLTIRLPNGNTMLILRQFMHKTTTCSQ